MRSIRYRLALLIFFILFGAVAFVYLFVVPRLESSLRAEKERGLQAVARRYSPPLAEAIGSDVSERRIDRIVRAAADRSGSRVTLLGVSRGTLGLQTYPISDSAADDRLRELEFQVAEEAAESRRPVNGSEPTNQGRVAEAARPLVFRGRVARVVVYSTPMGDVQANVELIRRRVLIAGGLALLLGVFAAFLVARALARRVKRLEQAAGQVAGGDFSQSLPVDSEDELGQLALAFNDMQAQLAQLDSARKRFIATASHELRTPIFSLGGFVELLEDEDLSDEERRQFLEEMRHQVARLRNLAVELLDLSKLEAGSLELHVEPTDVGLLARSVTREFTPALASHRSALDLRLASEPIEVLCDAERVAQIIRILLDNALLHTPTGTGIAVRAERVDGRVELAVEDRGLGIKRTVLPRIFEPFYTSDDAQGSGLGLAIARELADRMEGRLRVDTVPGRTTFTLELPTS